MEKGPKWIFGIGEKNTLEEKQLRLKFSLWVKEQKRLQNITLIEGVYHYENKF